MFLLMESHIFVFLAGNGCKWGKDGLVCAPLKGLRFLVIKKISKSGLKQNVEEPDVT